jgi:hypothetical protein
LRERTQSPATLAARERSVRRIFIRQYLCHHL